MLSLGTADGTPIFRGALARAIQRADDAAQPKDEPRAAWANRLATAALAAVRRHEDDMNAVSARRRLTEIDASPETVLRGEALERRLAT